MNYSEKPNGTVDAEETDSTLADDTESSDDVFDDDDDDDDELELELLDSLDTDSTLPASTWLTRSMKRCLAFGAAVGFAVVRGDDESSDDDAENRELSP